MRRGLHQQRLHLHRALVLLIMTIAFFFLNGMVASAAAENIDRDRLEEIHQLWKGSPHALNGVNCSSCHQDSETKALVVNPTQESCQSCHEFAVETFSWGKHGIRIHEGLSPLTPAMAHLPMKAEAKNKPMNCNACHNVHSVETVTASVDSCLTCHNDPHSLNYENSQHAKLFAKERRLDRPSTESVTCATCHLPRQKVNGKILVNHNNTYTLLPRDRMVKEVCMNCHGVEYAYNSIFDDELVEENFARPPTLEMETFDLVRALEAKRSGKSDRK